MQKLLLIALILCMPATLMAQDKRPLHPLRKHPFFRDRPTPEPYKRRGYPNRIMGNIPGLFIANGCLGGSVGMDFERFLSKEGSFSAVLPFYAFTASTFSIAGIRTGQLVSELTGFFTAPSVM